MRVISIVIILFIILESSNIIAMYFFPGTTKANSVGIFKAWEKSKNDPEIHDFVKYLVNWVAGTKLIFIFLLVAILYVGDVETIRYAAIALVLTMATFYWRLFPLIHKMDDENQINPKNYSKRLGWMILVFILVFLVAIIQ